MNRVIRVNIRNKWTNVELSDKEVESYYFEWLKENLEIVTKTLIYGKEYLKNVSNLTEEEKKTILQEMIKGISTPFVYFLEEKIYKNIENSSL